MVSLISQSIFVLMCSLLEISSSPVVPSGSDNLTDFTSNPDDKAMWKEFKVKYNVKCKDSREDFDKFSNFKNNVAKVKSQNAKYDAKKSPFFSRINENSYLDAHTWIYKTCGFRSAPLSDSDSSSISNNNHRRKRSTPPESLDYEQLGWTSPVKNQGGCGACYAFAAAGAIEGLAAKHFNVHTDLSAQQIVDCSGSHGNFGCNSGSTTAAFQYVKDAGGIKSSAKYPYDEGRYSCQTNGTAFIQISGRARYTYLTESDLKWVLANYGPVAVGINGLESFVFYGGGIYTEPECGTETQSGELNHGLLLVGYGRDDNGNYWKLKNSWGDSWGEGGFVRLSAKYNCGISVDVNGVW